MIESAIRQGVILIALTSVFSFGYNFIRTDGIPLIAEKKEFRQADLSDLTDTTLTGDMPVLKEVTLDLAKKMYDRGIIFVDARDEEEYRSGHIKGALNLSVIQLAEWLTFEDPVVVYCSGDECELSYELAESMVDFGFMKVFVFYGGWPEWVKAGYPVEIGTVNTSAMD